LFSRGVIEIRIISFDSRIVIVIAIILLGFIFSSYVNALYAFPNHSTSNATTTPLLTKDNSTTSNTPSVLHMFSVPPNNGTLSTSELSTNAKDKSNAATSSNSEMFHTHHGTSVGTIGSSTGSSTGSSDHNTNSHDLAHKIINKIKQKLKVGDVPFP